MAKLVDVIATSVLGVRSLQENPAGATFLDSSAAWKSLLARPRFTDPIGLLPSWERGWSSPPETLSILHHGLLELQPATVIETGTLAGHGTMAMATALQAIGKPANIYTFDYDGDPVQDAKGEIGEEEWRELASIRMQNLERIREFCPLVTIEFVDGDSRKTLPATLERSGNWDFWFQDSMHYKEGIYQEWSILKGHINPGAVIAFDNVDHRHAFGRHFIRNVVTEQWAYQTYISERNRQLWCRTPQDGSMSAGR